MQLSPTELSRNIRCNTSDKHEQTCLSIQSSLGHGLFSCLNFYLKHMGQKITICCTHIETTFEKLFFLNINSISK